jgi:vomeronasal 2 receptor
VQYCNQAQQSVQDKLLAQRQVTKIVIDAVYAIANAIKDRDGSETLLESLENVNFKSDMTGSQINYQNRAMLSNNYEFHQLQESGSGDTDSQLIGSWKPANEPKMEFDESSLKFKDGSTKIPLSACSPKCLPGTYRKYPEGGDKCCWTCTECDDGLITNTSNADVCLTCQQGFTALPNKTNCAEYNLVFFHWFSPMGQFMIFMMVVGICLTLFALGILSQNSDHIVVKLGGYKLMSCYLLGCTLLMLSPIAILIEPSTTTCSSFIGVFSIGVTIPLAVLISKAALITENLYDPEGDLIKNTLGRRPRALVVLIVLCAQVAVVIIGSLLSPPQIRHTESDRWDWKYAECANTKSASFWAPFFFNIFLGVLVNVMSCGAKRINDNFGELRNVCVTTLLFFLACLIHAILIFKLLNMNLMEGQALISVIYGLFFLVGFMFPKVHVILFEVVNEEEEVAIANAGETNDGDD